MTALPLWAREFGPEYNIPKIITREPGVIDLSYKHDACPSFSLTGCTGGDGDLVEVRLWVEHPDRDAREGNVPRYAVCHHTLDVVLYDGDDLAEALRVWRHACQTAFRVTPQP